MPPKVGSSAEMVFTISSTVGAATSMSKTSMPANFLNRTALPSITGLEASGPMLPRPSTAEPLEMTATRLARDGVVGGHLPDCRGWQGRGRRRRANRQARGRAGCRAASSPEFPTCRDADSGGRKAPVRRDRRSPCSWPTSMCRAYPLRLSIAARALMIESTCIHQSLGVHSMQLATEKGFLSAFSQLFFLLIATRVLWTRKDLSNTLDGA